MGCFSSSIFKITEKEAANLNDKMRRELEAEEVACVSIKQLSDLIVQMQMLVRPDELTKAEPGAFRATDAYLSCMNNIAEDRVRKLELTVTEIGLRLRRIEEVSAVTETIHADPTSSEEDKSHARMRWDALRVELLRDLMSIVVHRNMWHHSHSLAQLSDAYNMAKMINPPSQNF